ncbi:Atrochrysone carboxylic acid synthase [Colletotrichum gloeosporioides]|uniref:Atrochrysone carboxylic acid synthase n=1 Tax=Colletotrichum gloeosporioides TaxID=474922 RepID=A0A8H4FIZ9_COLGL|nr:Atrochrysone carboxylic acid synthase [Colletotrichum gloeosporioides]KAF3803825.1 Atrochrysone carboxylic acid synthase [Colletotrichum gloeosporioides]
MSPREAQQTDTMQHRALATACEALERVASIFVKRIEDVEVDNDNILGVAVDAGTNQSADAVSITPHNAGTKAEFATQIMRPAGVDPLDVEFIEIHESGTQI